MNKLAELSKKHEINFYENKRVYPITFYPDYICSELKIIIILIDFSESILTRLKNAEKFNSAIVQGYTVLQTAKINQRFLEELEIIINNKKDESKI